MGAQIKSVYLFVAPDQGSEPANECFGDATAAYRAVLQPGDIASVSNGDSQAMRPLDFARVEDTQIVETGPGPVVG